MEAPPPSDEKFNQDQAPPGDYPQQPGPPGIYPQLNSPGNYPQQIQIVNRGPNGMFGKDPVTTTCPNCQARVSKNLMLVCQKVMI